MTRDEAVRRAVAAAEAAEAVAARIPQHAERWAATAQAWSAVAHLLPIIEPTDPGTPLADLAAGVSAALRTSDVAGRGHVPALTSGPIVPGTVADCAHCGAAIKLNMFGVWLAGAAGDPYCRSTSAPPVVPGPIGYEVDDTQVMTVRTAMPGDDDIRVGSDEATCRYCGVEIVWRHHSVWLHVSPTGADEAACREPR